jgi:hypothetical protein
MRYLVLLYLGLSASIFALEQDPCPPSLIKPEEHLLETNNQADERVPYVDNNRPLKDLGTDIVVKEFFATKSSLYYFMKLVYTTMEKSLEKYKKQHDLDEKSISLLFKGGNVLRIIANGILELLPKDAQELLMSEYSPDFKRSDADFTVYIDDKKLGNLDYERVLDEVSKLILSDLNEIRKEFYTNKTKYFDFLKLGPYEARSELKKYFQELAKLPILEDKKNDDWFHAKFKQLQLLDNRAQRNLSCKYKGQHDYKFINQDNKIIGIPLSDKNNWIVNTDNRTLEWPMGNNPQEITKFNLLRSKVAFEYTYEKDGKLYRKPIAGELIDVSVPHRKDPSVREFLDGYEQNIAEYTLASPSKRFNFPMKSYSIRGFSHDLLHILFRQFDRPWNGGPKYGKRVNRLFFLALSELMGTYGIGSEEMKEYISAVREKIIKPLETLYPLEENASRVVKELRDNADFITTQWPLIYASNDLWQKLAAFVQDELIDKKQDDDEENFKAFIEIINKNLDIAEAISKMPYKKIDISKVYNTDMDKLF